MSESSASKRPEIEAKAVELGLVAIFPLSDEIQIDLDSGVINERVKQCLIDHKLGLTAVMFTQSKSGNLHVYAKLPKGLTSQMTAIAIQACLGSDPVREVLAVLRIMEGSDTPLALFETKAGALRVARWRDRNSPDAELITSIKEWADDDIPS